MEWLVLTFVIGGLACALGLLGLFLRLVGWVVFLPFRLVGLVLGLVGFLVMLPLFVVGAAAALTFGLLLVPLAVLAILAGAVWLVARWVGGAHRPVTRPSS